MDGEHPVIPPTFLTTMFFWEERTPGSNPWHLVKLDPKRGMHAEQEYVFHGPPPRAGTRLTCRSRDRERVPQGGPPRREADVRGDGDRVPRRSTGALVAEARMTGVETEKPPEATP